ncbi:hypothetical protein FRC02_009801 [Tulasnella sp. 418]|nr:hypothetical protein FRC02_009801 [Tulasnella sp. 418]
MRFGRSATGEPLVLLGNNQHQSIDRSKIFDARGSALVHVREGDLLTCNGVSITRNELGPSGEEWIEAIDGPEPDLSPYGPPLSDGITIACYDSDVSQNTITDVTGVGIIVFGAPGSVVYHNTLITEGTTSFGGIFLVSPLPFGGNYTGTEVFDNTIESVGPDAYVRVGIGMGTPVWTDDFGTILYNGTVKNNVVQGDGPFGYGFVLAGVSGFTVEDNISKAKYSGDMLKCPKKPSNTPPCPFLFNSTSSEGVFQPDFVDGAIQFVVCVSTYEANLRSEQTLPPLDSSIASEETAKPETISVHASKSSWETTVEQAEAHMLGLIDNVRQKMEFQTRLARHNSPYSGDTSDAEIKRQLVAMNKWLSKLEREDKEMARAIDSAKISIVSLKKLELSSPTRRIITFIKDPIMLGAAVTIQLLVAILIFVVRGRGVAGTIRVFQNRRRSNSNGYLTRKTYGSI